jgi:hypothetical protein
MHIIAVQPINGGWAVRSTSFENDLIYQSGGAAEAVARELGEKLAAEGQRSEIRIHLRDGSIVARFVCAPAAKPRLLWEGASEAVEQRLEPA